MINIEEYLNIEPYSLKAKDKQELLFPYLKELTKKHIDDCKKYGDILNSFDVNLNKINKIEDIFALPVRIFKGYDLKSCKEKDIIKTMTSSGTTSQRVSKIYLDKKTSMLQTKALVKIMQQFLGKKRLPMLIIDTNAILKDRAMFSARGAGILGLSNFGRDHTYALDENMQIDFDRIKIFLDKHKDEDIFIFGFTFMVWKYFYQALKDNNKTFDIQRGILVHSGGWKKLIDEAVDNDIFKQELKEQTRISKIHNFYGMVEQTGSIFVECEADHLHTPIFADIIIRDKMTLEPLPFGKEGIVEVCSILPHSYPGHVLLTEDIGMVLGEDDCSCGREGKYFNINGRLPKAEIRGCSDTHASDLKN